ncbi:MAG: glycosyltransferase [Pseudoflavonifractor sp.]|nr:glycosyltransferase [Pseudoflavonifractor sp.]
MPEMSELMPAVSLTLFVVALGCTLFLVLSYRRRLSVVASVSAAPEGGDGEAVPVSVIVYAGADSEGLARLLPAILGQRYDAPFEVIVINEGRSEATDEVVARLQLTHGNLYQSFTPCDTRNLSRRKLALTIGIKAARHEVVVLTCADAVIGSDVWLSAMARHFSRREVEMVLGYASPDLEGVGGIKERWLSYDAAAAGMQYLSAALDGRPYRGNGWNLAYRRRLFFENKGFSRSLNLRYGDDDLFVNEVARGDNAVVELSPESVLAIRDDDMVRLCREMRRRRWYVAPLLHTRERRYFGLCSVTVWGWLAASVAAVAMGWRHILVWAVAVAILLALWIPLVTAWRRASVALKSRRLCLTLPLMMLWRPVSNLITRLYVSRHRSRMYTWHSE